MSRSLGKNLAQDSLTSYKTHKLIPGIYSRGSKKMRFSLVLVNLYLIFSASQLKAVPSAYANKFGILDIENKTSSTLVRDSDDPNLIWVLPPSNGKKAYLSNLQKSKNLDFCDSLSNLTTASVELSKGMASVTKGFKQLDSKLTTAAEDVARQRNILAELTLNSDLSKLVIVEDQIIDLKKRREELLEKLDSCEQDNCYLFKSEYRDVKAKLQEKEDYLYELTKADIDLSRKYNNAKARLEALEKNYQELVGEKSYVLAQIAEIESLIMDLYASKAKLEGGYASIDFDSKWDSNVQALAQSYPSYEFRPIQTRNTRFYAGIVAPTDLHSYYESLPALLDYSLMGVPHLAAGEIPNSDSSHSLPSKITGTMRLSMIGACPLVTDNYFDDVPSSKGKIAAAPFSISANFEVPLLYSYHLKVKYNLYKVYEIIKRSGTKNGFFSSRSYRETIENTDMDEALEITWDDEAQAYTSKEKLKIQNEIKKTMIDRVLATMAEPVKSKLVEESLAIPSVPNAGAIVIADGLSKVCGFHIYCHAGSWILRGVYGVFGQSKVEDTFRQSHDIELTETWSSNDVKFVPATLAF